MMTNEFYELGFEDTIENEGSEFVLLSEGDYEFSVTKVDRGRHNGSDKLPPCNKAIVSITVWGENDKAELTENLMLCNKMEWRLSQFFLSLGLKKHGEPLKMNWQAAVGKKGRCHVYIDNYKNKNGEDRQSNKIKKFYAYDEEVQTVKPNNGKASAPQTGGWKAGTF
ncbi:MAG: DUF669 domain-containing protein [Ruminococcus sp.]|nr:DUF669 domain-containing protein [Ruminococcus sp.]